MTDWRRNLSVAIRKQLISESTIKGVVGTRCYIGELASLPAAEYPLVTFKINTSTGFLAYYTGTIRIWAWALNYEKVTEVYSIVETFINNILINDVDVKMNITLVSNDDTTDGYENDTRLYFRSGTVRFQATQLQGE